MLKEQDVKNAIIEWFFFMGGWATGIYSGMMFAEHKGKTRAIRGAKQGTPDILGTIRGKFIAVEVKRDEAAKRAWFKQTKPTMVAQYETLLAIGERGGYGYLACSVEDLEIQLRNDKIL